MAATEPAGDLEDCEFSLCTDTSDLVEKPGEWIIDNGASAHKMNDRDAFVSYTKLPVAQGVKLGDGRKVNAISQGIVKVEMNHAQGSRTVTYLKEVLHVPDLAQLLASSYLLTGLWHHHWVLKLHPTNIGMVVNATTHLRVFGCVGYAYVFKDQRRKLDDKAHMLWMVGYSIGTQGYHLLDENTGRISYRRDVVFNEDQFTAGDVMPEKQSEKMTVEVRENSRKVEVNAPPELGLGLVWEWAADIGPEEWCECPARIKVPTKRFIETCIAEYELEVSHYPLYGTETVELLSMTQALESPDADKWKAAAQEEYDALMQHDTWSLPPRRSTIRSK